ncbi:MULTISPECIES: hypothetical protein [unclassified Acinetobacter]|uniref:hypothetical protein n=1 Tax=unclassified Acinetobacter TaxID=196816 RepID=UPI0015D14EEC|nr:MULTISPECIES: hypothetical protein [unclassified Acinetobacter]
MNKYTNFKSIELVIDKNNPYTKICKELIDDSRLKLSYLASLAELKEVELLRYFCWIGGYGLAGCMFPPDDDYDNEVKQVINSIYKDAQGAFNELNKVSKISFTWDQATTLAVGITSIEGILREIAVDRESRDWNETEQYENFKQIIKIINTANFLIGHAMNDIYEAKAKNQIKKMASTGGKAKSSNYNTKMDPIFDEVFLLFQEGDPRTGKKWRFKSVCAKYFIKEFYLKNPKTDIDLDPKKLVKEITNRLNDLSASKKVTLLANRYLC